MKPAHFKIIPLKEELVSHSGHATHWSVRTMAEASGASPGYGQSNLASQSAQAAPDQDFEVFGFVKTEKGVL